MGCAEPPRKYIHACGLSVILVWGSIVLAPHRLAASESSNQPDSENVGSAKKDDLRIEARVDLPGRLSASG